MGERTKITMMKRRYVILVLSYLLAVGAAEANPVTENQAREIASRFMATKSPTLKLSAGAPTLAATPVTRQAAFYVFNSAVADKGFVIVAGDDRLPAVLGYSDSGSFDADAVPPAMQEWLDGYAAQVEAIAAGATPEVRTVLRLPIAPLLPVHWGQGAPYNVLLPHVDGSSYAHAYVGCVATAMAQILGYWRYPPRPTQTIPGYTSDEGTVQMTMPPLEPMDFDWENMHPAYYVNDSTSEACQAVANLMLYSTTAMKSNFGKTQTSAAFIDIPDVLMTYFGYKNTAHYINRASFSTQSWEDAIYDELWAGCPVAYTGSKLSAGHAFVCDGYDGEGRFHINWGWEGKSNGYFFLNLLNPDSEGIGSAAGNYSYVKLQMAVIGLMPGDVGGEGTATLSFEQLTLLSSTTTRESNYSNFSVTLSGQFVNNTNVTSRFQLGWGLYNQQGELVKVLCTLGPTDALGFRRSFSDIRRTLSFGAGITSGTYRILPIYHIYPGEEDYLPCIGSDVDYIEVTINNKSCTVKGFGISGSTAKYTVNSCTISGTCNHGKPLTIKLTATNAGTTTNDIIYMFVNGSFTALGLASIEPGKRGDIVYRYTPSSAGTISLSFSLNQSGTPILYSKDVTINTMPSANLDVSYRILNITDEQNRIITADRYSIIADVTNIGTTDYDEDFTARLYRVTNDNTNSSSELLSLSKPLFLPAGESKSLQFDFDHDLVNGWKYLCWLSYYSNGKTVNKSTKWYTINLINDPMIPTPRYSVITHVEPNEGGTVHISSGHTFADGKIEAGETITITPNPSTGWLFSGVTVTDSIGNPVEYTATGENIYAFVMPESDVNVTVNYVSMPRITVNVEPSHGGDAQLSGSFVVDDKIMAGETVSITPIPNSGWCCGGVTVVDTIGNPVEVSEAEDGTYAFVVPNSDIRVTVNFETMPSVIANMVPNCGGDVLFTGHVFEDNMFKVGEPVTIIPKPNIGWQCSGATATDSIGNSVEVSEAGDGTYVFVMPRSNVSVNVNFERSTGSLFELIQGASEITEDVTYVLINRNSDKVMRCWSESDTTFQSQDVVEWLDDGKNVVRVDDDACFFTMSQISDTIVAYYSSQVYKAAYMTTGNGYIGIAGNNSNVILNKHIGSQSRAWVRFGKISNNMIPFICYAIANSGLSYDNGNDVFKMMTITVSSTNPRYVYFYKLVEAYNLITDFDLAQGNVEVTGGIVDGTVQRGETVTFTVTPAQGYTTALVQVITTSGEAIVANWDEATGSYSFIMPVGDVIISAAFEEYTEPDFILGDVDRNGMVDISDLTALIDYILGIDVEINLAAADVNEDGIIDIADVTELIDILLIIN